MSTCTYVLMVCALRFFYTQTLHRNVAIERFRFPRRQRKLPSILSREEVKALLEALSSKFCEEVEKFGNLARRSVSSI